MINFLLLLIGVCDLKSSRITNNSMVDTREEEGWGEGEKDKGCQIYGDGKRLDSGW